MFRSKVILSWTRVLTFKSRTLPRSFLLQKNRDQPLESKNRHQSKDLVQVLQRVTDLLERLGPEAHLRCWRTTVSWSSWRRLLLLSRTYESGDTWGRPDGPVKFGHWTSQCETSGPRLPQVFHVLLFLSPGCRCVQPRRPCLNWADVFKVFVSINSSFL